MSVIKLHAQHGSGLGIHGRLPQLLGIHLTKTLVALDGGLALDRGEYLVTLLIGIGIAVIILALADTIQRRLCDIDMPLFDQRAHIAEEEGEQQGADMRAVDVRIRHDDDLVITELFGIELLTDARAERGDDRGELIVAVDLIETRFFDIEHLTPQGQDRLKFSVASLLGGAARGVTLYDVDLCLTAILRLAVGELTGE